MTCSILLLSGLGVLFLLYHLLFCSPIVDRVWKVTGSLKIMSLMSKNNRPAHAFYILVHLPSSAKQREIAKFYVFSKSVGALTAKFLSFSLLDTETRSYILK